MRDLVGNGFVDMGEVAMSMEIEQKLVDVSSKLQAMTATFKGACLGFWI